MGICGLNVPYILLLQHGAKVSQGGMGTKWTELLDEALCNATRMYSGPRIVEALIFHGARINSKYEGTLPLINAVYEGDIRITKALLRHGANVHLTAEVDSGRQYVNFNALMMAINMGHIEITKLLIQWGSDINCSIEATLNILRDATKSLSENSLQIMKILLLHGADIQKANKRDMRGTWFYFITPLTIAMKNIEWTEDNQLLSDYIMLLHAAGGSNIVNQLNFSPKYKHIVKKVAKNNRDHFSGKIRLVHVCKWGIRAHLMDSDGGNQNNLIQAVLQLPLPRKLRKFLLLDIDISWMDQTGV